MGYKKPKQQQRNSCNLISETMPMSLSATFSLESKHACRDWTLSGHTEAAPPGSPGPDRDSQTSGSARVVGTRVGLGC